MRLRAPYSSGALFSPSVISEGVPRPWLLQLSNGLCRPLAWTAPPLAASDVSLIDVFDSATPNSPITTIQGAATDFTTGDLASGDHVFTVIIQDTGGRRSDASNAAAVTVAVTPPPVANPAAVTDLSATSQSLRLLGHSLGNTGAVSLSAHPERRPYLPPEE